MEELKKCPFCGGEARIKMERKNNVGWTIWCECKKNVMQKQKDIVLVCKMQTTH